MRTGGNRVRELARKHGERERRFVQLKWPESSLDLKALFGALLKLSMVRSADLYERNGFPPHELDVEPEFGDSMIHAGSFRIGYFERLAKKIIVQVGIEELQPAGAR